MAFVALENSLAGLNAAQRQIELTSRNIANASTAGYTKKSLQQIPSVVAGQVMGVQIGQVQRTVDQSLQKSLWSQTSSASSYDTMTTYLDRLQQLQGGTDSTTNISSVISTLQNGFTELSASPDDGIAQSKVVSQAVNVVRSFNQYSTTLQTLRNNTQTEMSDTVNQINQDTAQIAKLNQQILQFKANGQSTADIEDQRDQSIKDLSQYMDISTYADGDSVAVQTKAGGILLATTQSYPLSFSPQTLSATTAYPGGAAAVTIGTDNITTSKMGGKLGALVQLRDEILPQQQAQLDELSQKMAVRFNAQGVKLFVDSSTGDVPPDTVSNYVGFASRMVVNPAIVNDATKLQSGTSGTPPNTGSNAVILKVLSYTFGLYSDASNTPNTAFRTGSLGAGGNLSSGLPSTATLADYAQNFIGTNAQFSSLATAQKTSEEDYRQTLEKSFLDQSGVSIDSEMANMITLQKAYASNAKAFSTVGTMFDQLLAAIN